MDSGVTAQPDVMGDVCALPLVQRVAALLDRDPAAFRDGDALPRGWHVALFTVPTPQSRLRDDGLASLGFTLPDLGLPRIMAGGKQTRFDGDIPIGASVRRISQLAGVTPKQGRSGRFAVVGIEHQIFADDADRPVLTEQQDYIMREADSGSAAPVASSPAPAERAPAEIERVLVPDEAMLLRYCAITFNTHRIHYDHAYATQQEGYPALVVNGGLPLLFLLEMFRQAAGHEPASITLRNQAPLYCGRPARLCATRSNAAWRLWAEDDAGRLAVEIAAQ